MEAHEELSRAWDIAKVDKEFLAEVKRSDRS